MLAGVKAEKLSDAQWGSLIKQLDIFTKSEQYHQLLETIIFCIKIIEDDRWDCDDAKFYDGLSLLLECCKHLVGVVEEFFYSQRLGAIVLRLVEALRNQAALSGQKRVIDFIVDCLPYTIDSHIPYKTLCNHECGSVEDFFPSHCPNPYHLLNEMHTECLRKAQSNLERYLETAIVTRVIDYWRTLFNTSNECGDILQLIELGEDLLERIKVCTDSKRTKALWKMVLLLQMLLRDHPAVKTLKAQDWPAGGFVQSLLPFESQSSSLSQQSLNKPISTLLKDYRPQLQESRVLFGPVAQGNGNVFKAQESHSRQVIKMLEEMALATRKLLGPPPCEIVVCVLGSTSRHDRRPYSDLEYMILHQEVPVDKQQELDLYICHFISIFELMIVSLGETSSNHNNNRNGFKIDQSLLGLTVSFKSKSWGTPEEVAKKYVIELNEPPHGWLDKGLFEYLHPIALECPELGSRALFEQYLKELDGYLNQVVSEKDSPQEITKKFKIKEDWWRGLTRRQGIALASLCEVVHFNENMYLTINAGRQVNLKTFYYKPLLYCALSLGMYEGCQALTPSKTIETYCATMPWGGEALLLWWKAALRYVVKEQVKQHLIEGCQHDLMMVSEDACWAGFDLIVEGFILPLQRGVRECLSGSLPVSMMGHVLLKNYLNVRKAWLEKWKEKGFARSELLSHPLMQVLSSYPDESGWSPQMELILTQHHEGLLKLSSDRITACEFAGLPVEGKQPPRYLNEEILQQCFKEGKFVGDPELSSERSQSQVKKVMVGDKNWYIKVKVGNLEGLMAREYLAMMLHLLLGGKPQIALGWPIKLALQNEGKTKPFYAWISEEVKNESFAEKMRSSSAQWGSLNFERENFSQLFLFTFLTCPEDGQPENFKIIESEGKIKLIAIDYGQCFVVADRQEKSFFGYTTSVLTIKTIIYLLGAMHLPLSEELITRIRLLDVEAWYARWKESLEGINALFKPLLKEDIGLIPPLNRNKSNALIDIPDGVLLCIKSRLTLLQHWLRTTQKPITGQSILESLEPLVASQYAFLKPVIKTPEDFYQKIDVKAYVKDPKSGKTVSSATWTSLEKQTLTPQQLARSCDLGSSYFRRVKFKCLNEVQQEYHLQLLESVAERKGKDFINLNLSGCKIHATRLIRILEKMANLQSLDLSGCRGITVMTIAELLAHRPNAGIFTYSYEVLCSALQVINLTVENANCTLVLNASFGQRQKLTGQMRHFLGLFERTISLLVSKVALSEGARYVMIEAFGWIRRTEDLVVRALLRDPEKRVDDALSLRARVLERLAKAEDRVIECLVNAMLPIDSEENHAAVALWRLRKVEDRLIETLLRGNYNPEQTEPPELVKKALRWWWGKAKDGMIEVSLRALADFDRALRAKAVQFLGRSERAEDRVVRVLLRGLGDFDREARAYVNPSLRLLQKAEDHVIDLLLRELADLDPEERAQIVQSLGRLEQAESRMIELLLRELADPDPEESVEPVQPLSLSGKTKDSVFESLLLKLENFEREMSAQSLSLKLLEKTKDSTSEALLRALEDFNWDISAFVTNAIGRLGETENRLIEALIVGLRKMGESERELTAQAWGQIGRADGRIIVTLVEMLRDPKEKVRSSAARALGQLGDANDRVIVGLAHTLGDRNGNVRSSAAWALGQLGRADGGIIGALMYMLSDEDRGAKTSAARALGRLGRLNDRLVEVLLGVRGDPLVLPPSNAAPLGELFNPKNCWRRIQGEVRVVSNETLAPLNHVVYDATIKRIYFFVDDRFRRSLPQVCRKWRDLYDEFKEEQSLQSVPELRLSASLGYQRPFSRVTFFRTFSSETVNVSDKEVSQGEGHHSKLGQMQASDPDVKEQSDKEEVVNHREENKSTK